MIRGAYVFLALAVLCGLLGFTGLAGDSTALARNLFSLFLVVFILGLVFSPVVEKPLAAH